MHAVFLGLAMASGWSDLQVGGELRLDASAERLDLAGTSEGPQYGVGISRGALMLGAEPTFSTEVLLVMDVRSTGTELLLANDGSLVEVPPGFEAHLLDARLHKVAPRWAGAIGRSWPLRYQRSCSCLSALICLWWQRGRNCAPCPDPYRRFSLGC